MHLLLLQVQRLAQYEQYLEQLLSAQRDEQEEVARARRAKDKEVHTYCHTFNIT